MSSPRRICYLLASTTLHGGATIAFRQAEELQARGFETVIAATDGPPDWYDLGVPLHTVPEFGGRHVPQADLYMGTSFTTVPGAHDTGLGIGAHLVEGYEGDLPGNAALRGRIEFVYGLKTVKFAVSPHLVELVRERFDQPCRLTRNGVDTALFHAEGRTSGGNGGPLRVGVVGPFEGSLEGVPTALAAVEAVRREGHRLELVRVTAEPPGAIERSLHPADELHVGVPPATVGDILRSCDIAVSASTALEGFGLPALEALACGCATVLSDIPAHRGLGAALGGFGPYARFAAPEEPGSFTDALRELVLDEGRRAELQASGAALGRRYSWSEVGDELAEVIGGAIDAEQERWAVRNERMVPGESDALTELCHRQRYEFARTFASGRRALDAGCGVGYGARDLLDAGARSVLALDYSEGALRYARAHYDAPGITWQQADLMTYPFVEDSADLVTCFEVFEHVERPADLLDRLAGALAPGGRALVTTPNRGFYSMGSEPAFIHHVREYEEDEFTALLGAFFGSVEILGQGARDARLVIDRPDQVGDMTFIGVCGDPLPVPGSGPMRLVASPSWWDEERPWRALLHAWCEAFEAGDDVSLVIVTGDGPRAESELLAALAEAELDPGAVPDIVVVPVGDTLAGVAEHLRSAGALTPYGAFAETQVRLAACFGATVLEQPDVPALRSLLREHEARRGRPVLR